MKDYDYSALADMQMIKQNDFMRLLESRLRHLTEFQLSDHFDYWSDYSSFWHLTKDRLERFPFEDEVICHPAYLRNQYQTELLFLPYLRENHKFKETLSFSQEVVLWASFGELTRILLYDLSVLSNRTRWKPDLSSSELFRYLSWFTAF